MRWSLSLQEYDLKITHIKGKLNTLADILSRMDKINHKKDDILIATMMARQVDKNLVKSLKNLKFLHRVFIIKQVRIF